MQKAYALFNLKEAKSALEDLIADMESDVNYDIGSYIVDIQHLYWHINSAWNGRDLEVSAHELTDDMYEQFIQFPKDLSL